jgi:dolichyl-phosphate beta-glucosyltransferase
MFSKYCHASVYQILSYFWRVTRWCFDVELVYLCKHLRIPMAEVSVNWTEIPGSKVRMTSILHMVFELLLIKVGYGLSIWKIYS